MSIRVVFILLSVLLAALPAGAHSRIVRVEQKAEGPSGRPATLTLHFDVAIETRFSRFHLEVGGTVHDLRLVTTEAQAVRVELQLPDVPAGPAILRWNLLSSDGHREKGEQAVKLAL